MFKDGRRFRGDALRRFVVCQRGAMTIDWTALTSSALLLAIAVVYGIYSTGVSDVSGVMNDTLENQGSVADHSPTPGPDTFR